jgi:Lsr2
LRLASSGFSRRGRGCDGSGAAAVLDWLWWEELDLSKKNAAAFRRKLAPFIDHARKAGRGQRRRPGRTAASRDRSGSIRAWAKQAGIAVSARGRIPASVVEQYQAATQRP